MSGWNPSGPQQPPQPSGPQQPDPAQYPPQQGYPPPQAYPPQQPPLGPTPPYPPQLMQQPTTPSQYPPQGGDPQPGVSGPQAGYPQPYPQPSAPQGYPQQPNPSTPLGQSGALVGAQYGQPPYTPTQGYPQPYPQPSAPQGYPQQYTQQAYPGAPAVPGQATPPYGPPQPSYPSGYPPPPPPARRTGRIALIAGGAVAILVILGLVVGLALARGGGVGGNPTANATATTAATATPSAVGTATLGGTIANFSAKYGAPISSSATTGIYQVTIAGQSISALMSLQIGLDQTPRIAQILLSPSDANSTGWDQTTTMTLITDLVPADAQLDQAQSNNTFGLTRVFVSQSLAHTFTPGLFTNLGNNTSVPPGTLTVLCLPSSTSSANFSICTFSLGLA
ncbi:MAG TPA: hypothetical protein VMV29_09955 [Ktedonobacterales bacterium]|nr:hypothetical protein [Ktedonobacterales bacterium]